MEARERIRRKKVLNCFHVVNESQTTKKLLAAVSLSLSLSRSMPSSLSLSSFLLSLALSCSNSNAHTHTRTHTHSHALDFLLSSAMTCGSMHDQLPDEDSVSEGKMKTPHSLTLLLSLTYPRKRKRKHTHTPTFSPFLMCHWTLWSDVEKMVKRQTQESKSCGPFNKLPTIFFGTSLFCLLSDSSQDAKSAMLSDSHLTDAIKLLSPDQNFFL